VPKGRKNAVELRVWSSATYARALVLGNPLVDQIRARGSIDPERVIEELAEVLPREFGTDPMRVPLQAIVFEARR